MVQLQLTALHKTINQNNANCFLIQYICNTQVLTQNLINQHVSEGIHGHLKTDHSNIWHWSFDLFLHLLASVCVCVCACAWGRA